MTFLTANTANTRAKRLALIFAGTLVCTLIIGAEYADAQAENTAATAEPGVSATEADAAETTAAETPAEPAAPTPDAAQTTPDSAATTVEPAATETPAEPAEPETDATADTTNAADNDAAAADASEPATAPTVSETDSKATEAESSTTEATATTEPTETEPEDDATTVVPTATPAKADAAKDDSSATGATAAGAAGAVAVEAVSSIPKTEASLSDLLDMFNKQQADLRSQQDKMAEQQKQLDEQSQLIAGLRKDQEGTQKSQQELVAKQDEQITAQRQSLQSMQSDLDRLSGFDPTKATEQEVAMRSRLETLEESLQNTQDAGSSSYDQTSFPGSNPVPGTNAAIKFGGYVKMNIVESLDPVGSLDRFIVGTIPVPQGAGTAQAALTVQQSRLNWELREQTKGGQLRAFIEGDFAGEGETFRLRHAFGQYQHFLAGKTWSTFMDSEASPEELDFEGINGRINVRQAQVRYFPEIGRDMNFLISLEDPQPDVRNGDSISQIPDIVASIRRTWFERWHVKTAALFRQIESELDCSDVLDPDCSAGAKDKVTGWALTVSGKTAIPRWDRRDNFMFQVNYGKGYGRYVNDLGTVGGEDAVFNPATGEMTALPVFATYLAFQHWWTENSRSTWNASYVNIDNTSFELPDAYRQTFRTTGNYIWSPTPRIDIGAELLWGKRENKNGETGNATQIQISSKYRF